MDESPVDQIEQGHAHEERGLSRWLDVWLVIVAVPLSLLISALMSIVFSGYGDSGGVSVGEQLYSSLWYMTSWLPAFAILAYLMLSRGESWARFGFTRVRLGVDGLLGLLYALVWFASYYVVAVVFAVTGLWMIDAWLGVYADYEAIDYSTPSTWMWVFVGLGTLVSAFAEEWVFRSYLLTRMCDEGMGSARAVLCSSALFAMYHIYQGVEAFVDIFLSGCLFAVFFLCVRRIWPLVIAHFLWNMWVTMSYGF